jgi:DNA repair exonuclease SbcCD nuclease subunit
MIVGSEQLSQLSQASIPIVVIVGNHELFQTIFSKKNLKAF